MVLKLYTNGEVRYVASCHEHRDMIFGILANLPEPKKKVIAQ